MNNKHIVREIKVNKKEYIVEIIVGAIAVILSLVPDLKNSTYFGIPANFAFLIIGALAIIVGIIQLSKSKSANPILIYEDHIEFDEFSSNMDALIVQKHKRSLKLINGDKSKVIDFALSKADYNYLVEL